MAPKSAASKKVASHPKYKEMITQAIANLKERNGSSRQAIKKYIHANFKGLDANADIHINLALKRGVESGDFQQPKGASGPVKLSVKPKVAKETKKESPVPEKKTVAKKPAATKPKADKVVKKAAPAKPKATKKTTTKAPGKKTKAAPAKKAKKVAAPVVKKTKAPAKKKLAEKKKAPAKAAAKKTATKPAKKAAPKAKAAPKTKAAPKKKATKA